MIQRHEDIEESQMGEGGRGGVCDEIYRGRLTRGMAVLVGDLFEGGLGGGSCFCS
jgi:hypothetical protein